MRRGKNGRRSRKGANKVPVAATMGRIRAEKTSIPVARLDEKEQQVLRIKYAEAILLDDLADTERAARLNPEAFRQVQR